MSGVERVRVAIDARIPPGQWGGVEFVAKSLVGAIAHVEPGIDASVIVDETDIGWVNGLASDNIRAIGATQQSLGDLARRINAATRRLPDGVSQALSSLVRPVVFAIATPRRDRLIESLGVDVVHFVSQRGYRTSIPSIYQPHDLQHVHLPEHFTGAQRAYREMAYRFLCKQAAFVVVMTEWGRNDLAASIGIPMSRIAVIPWAPVLHPSSGQVKLPTDLAQGFILYPAQTWPHKNHIRLVEAVALLRDRGRLVNLVCIGRLNDHFNVIERRVRALHVEGQVRFLGFVDDPTVDALYRRAAALVFPSLFEGWGLPIVEAFGYGVPVAASRATVLPEVAKGAAALFDPLDVDDIARSIELVVWDSRIRDELISRGRARANEFSWTRTAATFGALYRRAAGRAPTESDEALLAPPTLVDIP